MAELKEAPAGASMGVKRGAWIAQPLPDRLRRVPEAHVRVLRAEELQRLVLLRLAGDAGAGDRRS